MNRDSEAINSILAWLFQDPSLTERDSSGEASDLSNGLKGSGTSDLHRNILNRSVAEGHTINDSDFSIFQMDSQSGASLNPSFSSHVGDLPAVQDRFHALLKRRLRAEIAQKPPVFPWESNPTTYGTESEDLVAAESVPMKGWVQQIQKKLPVPMSEELVAGLLQRCQEMAHSSLQRGAQLVRAVESLFPDEPQTLNHLAGLVLTSPARSPELQTGTKFPGHYETATPVQKMALSLLAAQEIMENLTLFVSKKAQTAVRSIPTDYGSLAIETKFDPFVNALKVEVQLPCGGHLQLSGSDGSSVARRDQAGLATVELFDVEGDRTYFLDVQLNAAEPVALKFAIQLDD
ncbi:MAG: PatU [Cyanobacteria bacterium J06633_2]